MAKDPQHEGDEAVSFVNRAASAGLDAIAEYVEGEGDEVIAAYAFVLIRDGKPNGGQGFRIHETDGPESAEDLLAVLLNAVSAFAQANDLPMAIMDMPVGDPGGQG